MNPIYSKSNRFLPILAIVVLALNGCVTTRIGDFTIISTKNYEASAKYKMVGRFTGQDHVFVFIIDWGTPNIKSAVDNAIEAGNGVYLTNAVLEWYTGFMSKGYTITGDVWALASESDLINPNIELYDLKVSNGKPVLQGKTKVVPIEAGLSN